MGQERWSMFSFVIRRFEGLPHRQWKPEKLSFSRIRVLVILIVWFPDRFWNEKWNALAHSVRMHLQHFQSPRSYRAHALSPVAKGSYERRLRTLSTTSRSSHVSPRLSPRLLMQLLLLGKLVDGHTVCEFQRTLKISSFHLRKRQSRKISFRHSQTSTPHGMENRSLLALPSRLGGMGIRNPTEVRSKHQRASQEVCAPLVLTMHLGPDRRPTCQSLQASIKARLRREKRVEEMAAANNIIRALPDRQRQCVKASQERGVSSWLSVILLEKHGFVLHVAIRVAPSSDTSVLSAWQGRGLMLIASLSASLAASTRWGTMACKISSLKKPDWWRRAR